MKPWLEQWWNNRASSTLSWSVFLGLVSDFNICILTTYIQLLLLLYKLLSHVQLSSTPWTVAWQTPLPTGFPRWEHWSGLPFPSPGGLPHPGTEPLSPALAGGFFTVNHQGKQNYGTLQNYHLLETEGSLQFWSQDLPWSLGCHLAV